MNPMQTTFAVTGLPRTTRLQSHAADRDCRAKVARNWT